jgi:hypothetical protein
MAGSGDGRPFQRQAGALPCRLLERRPSITPSLKVRHEGSYFEDTDTLYIERTPSPRNTLVDVMSVNDTHMNANDTIYVRPAHRGLVGSAAGEGLRQQGYTTSCCCARTPSWT